MQLLDYASLRQTAAAFKDQARLEALQKSFDDTAPADTSPGTFEIFSLDKPIGTISVSNAILAGPVAAHHAACALVAWIHAQPGAVINPADKALEVASQPSRPETPGRRARRRTGHSTGPQRSAAPTRPGAGNSGHYGA